MDEEWTTRDVLAAAGRPPRPQLREDLWADLLDELDGSSRAALIVDGGPRRWPRRTVLGVAAAAVIAALAVAVWPRDQRVTITDTGTVPAPTTVAGPTPATDAGPASTVGAASSVPAAAPLASGLASTVVAASSVPAAATPATGPASAVGSTTTTSIEPIVPTEAVRAIGADGQSVELLASDGCGPGGVGCFTADMPPPELPAFRSGQVSITGAGGAVTVNDDEVPALPVPGGDWQFTRWPDAAPAVVTIRDDRADGSWDTYPSSCSTPVTHQGWRSTSRRPARSSRLRPIPPTCRPRCSPPDPQRTTSCPATWRRVRRRRSSISTRSPSAPTCAA